MFGLTLAAAIVGCDGGSVLGGVEKPDLGYTLSEASEQVGLRSEPQLIYQRCEKLKPIVEPVRQRWSCWFGFRTGESTQDCSVIMSVQGDYHQAIWKPDIGELDPASGKLKPNLICKRRTPPS